MPQHWQDINENNDMENNLSNSAMPQHCEVINERDTVAKLMEDQHKPKTCLIEGPNLTLLGLY
jgi:hypothetical protein